MKLCTRIVVAALGLAVFASMGCNKNSTSQPASTNSVSMPMTNNMAGGMTKENTNMPAAPQK